MAVTRIGARAYVGLSTDAKPSPVPTGSLFIERNTGDTYITDDEGTTWGRIKLGNAWSAAVRTLTALTGQPRTDLVGSDAAVWAHATRVLTALTGQPRTDLVGSDAAVWSHATRVLTDISMEEVLDIPATDGGYLGANPTGGGANVFGAWAEISADVGVGRRLLYATAYPAGALITGEIELGVGAGGAEARTTGFSFAGRDAGQATTIPLFKSLADNVRLSVRWRDSGNIGGSVHVVLA